MVFSAVLVALVCGRALSAQQTRTTWKDYLGGPDSSHYSALKQINTGNVNKLDVAWSYPTGDEVTYTFSPLVIDNMAYFAAKQGSLVAVDATTGKEMWVHPFAVPGAAPSRFGGIAGMRGANYWESKDRTDRRLLVSSGGFLQAIDARTGKLVDSFADHGKLDLKIGLDRGNRPLSSRTPGRVFENILILGSATGEGYLAPPGDIRAFDVVTGKLLWVFHTIPRPGEFGYETWPKDAYKYMGGVDVWGEITVDEKRGIAYFPVASAKYELYGGDRPGNNLYADCVLALDARTGKHLWHFQTVHHDVWDYDPDAAPQLVTVKHDGKTVDAVAFASKNNFLYVFDRVTGKPLWPIEERPVPQTDVPGEITSKTQPFPTVVPPFGRQGMTVKDMYEGFMKPEEVAWWRERLTKARTGFYTPPAVGVDTINFPSVNGGALFFSTGADATNGTVYVLGKNMPSIIKLVPAGESTSANVGGLIPARTLNPGVRRGVPGFPTKEEMGRVVYEQNCQVCHGPELKGDRGPEIDTAVSRLGTEATHNVITKGRATMPAFSSIPASSMSDLMAFLKQPDLAPLGSAPTAAAQAMMRSLSSEPAYPEDIEGPPSRYKTGYGNEPYVTNPPWSTITAYDLNTGKIKWQTPYGDVPQAGPSDKMRGNTYPKSGFVITAGGLVMFAGNDSKLYALNSTTGKLIFSKDLPNGSQGVPAVYEVNGREYILLAVSGGGTPYPDGAYMPPGGVSPLAISKGYIAFALPAGGDKR
ncbi:PQQ-binding-like beta-propeller repeat protein [Granulicella sp. dw_53]|uniref:outer membrane protein assembly factor BamB family protein n=1 Tax=Granulicella sp. dw_53 TaxID=2719792 RepID=UPI001BD40131|nr:PQQ-binding-like beta-propeller repeat protein [Granulicella sp. dw_53]